MNKRIKISLFIYLILIIILIVIKPQYLFNKNGTLKQFGTGDTNTIIPLWMLILLAAFLSYYVTHIILHIHEF